jgi:hypothetical protein
MHGAIPERTQRNFSVVQDDLIANDLVAGRPVIHKLVPVGCGVIRRWAEDIIGIRRKSRGKGFDDAGSRARCDAGKIKSGKPVAEIQHVKQPGKCRRISQGERGPQYIQGVEPQSPGLLSRYIRRRCPGMTRRPPRYCPRYCPGSRHGYHRHC